MFLLLVNGTENTNCFRYSKSKNCSCVTSYYLEQVCDFGGLKFQIKIKWRTKQKTVILSV